MFLVTVVPYRYVSRETIDDLREEFYSVESRNSEKVEKFLDRETL